MAEAAVGRRRRVRGNLLNALPLPTALSLPPFSPVRSQPIRNEDPTKGNEQLYSWDRGARIYHGNIDRAAGAGIEESPRCMRCVCGSERMGAGSIAVEPRR